MGLIHADVEDHEGGDVHIKIVVALVLRRQEERMSVCKCQVRGHTEHSSVCKVEGRKTTEGNVCAAETDNATNFKSSHRIHLLGNSRHRPAIVEEGRRLRPHCTHVYTIKHTGKYVPHAAHTPLSRH